MSIVFIWSSNPFVCYPFDSFSYCASSMNWILVHFSQPTAVWVYLVLIPHDCSSLFGSRRTGVGTREKIYRECENVEKREAMLCRQVVNGLWTSERTRSAISSICFLTIADFRHHRIPRGLVVRIRRSHRRGPGSIPGVGKIFIFLHR